MTLALTILADTDNGTVGKIIFVILGLVVWGVGALASMVKKQKRQEEERQRAMMEQVRLEMQAARAAGAGAPRRMREAVPVPPPAPGYRPNVLPDWEPQQGITVPPPHPPVYAPPRQYTPVPPYAAPAPPQLHPQPQPQKRRKQPKRDRRPQAPVPAVPVEEAPPVRPLAAGEAPPKSARAAGSSANAAALSRWMTPRTLRSQFILTEILQPPLALREPRDV